MITFAKDNKLFVFRSVGIMFNDGHVLLHKAGDNDFWSLPGGRVELLEKAESTIVREMQEELNVDVTVVRLVWVAENFFEYAGKSYHELGFYFLLQLPGNSPFLDKIGNFYSEDAGTPLIFRWFSINQLETLTLYPSFLKTSLRSLPTGVEHIIHIGNDTRIGRKLGYIK
jgi:ADP-ribose pyrophosphatase YjhB (NUDIX family)